MEPYVFNAAKPVWLRGRQKEMNVSFVLRAVLPGGIPAEMHIAGHTDYQIFINGAFFAQGPARAGHGFFRAEEYDLAPALKNEINVVCILCAGYNANSFYLTDQPSFICAEIVSGGKTLFATGTANPFTACEYRRRVQRVQRYSFQRPFTESYVFAADYDRVFTDPAFTGPAPALEETAGKRFIKRDTPKSDYEERTAKSVRATGTAAAATPEKEFRDRSFNGVDGKGIKGYKISELEVCVVNELYGYRFTAANAAPGPAGALRLEKNGFTVYDMGRITTGYIRLALTPESDATVFAVFNQKLPADGVPDPGEDACATAVRWELAGGRRYDLVSFEPYTYRYICVFTLGAGARVDTVSQYAEHYPASGLLPKPGIGDPALSEIFDAATETFRQNATDIFMDCPSRERGGWLCDSFFTARTEYALTGKSLVEKAFLENFLMEDGFKDLPEGMLPMCYPSDHPDGTYIPNWAMWYGLELAEYKARGGDEALILWAKPKMYALAGFLARFENEYGLLEKLKSWVFVEWSRANDFTQDVNYPTNMLYAKFLDSVGGLCGDAEMQAKAERIRGQVRKLSFDGTFFTDNALRQNGILVPTRNHTETAQYYAFFTGTATPESHPALWKTMLEDFGPGRDPETQYPDVPVANAFIGNYLRLDLLFRAGEYRKLADEIRAFFLPMAKASGTLWENMTDFASCCHGFASHTAVWIKALSAER